MVAPLYDAMWQYSGELTLDTSKSALLIDMNEVASVGAYASDESIMEFNGELVWYRSMRTIEQSLDLLMRISGEESVVEANGNFSFARNVPDQPGEHGLYLSMYNPPSGAVLRGLVKDRLRPSSSTNKRQFFKEYAHLINNPSFQNQTGPI